MHSCKVAMRPELQRRLGCTNVMGHVVYGFTEESGFYELRRIMRAIQSKKNPIPSPMGAWRLLRFSNDALRMLFGQFLAKRRVSSRFARSYLAIDCEQAPLFESRITLGDKTDALGVPRAVLDWRLSDLERHTLREYMRRFRATWEAMDLGEADWSTALDGDSWMEECDDTYHHAGTTRMHTNARRGVVDTNLKVHGIANLYIGSMSVFPTSSCANPTLTMMALCIRLADHLKQDSQR
jgi:choline dehydrogenase-like flavoprotein